MIKLLTETDQWKFYYDETFKEWIIHHCHRKLDPFTYTEWVRMSPNLKFCIVCSQTPPESILALRAFLDM